MRAALALVLGSGVGGLLGNRAVAFWDARRHARARRRIAESDERLRRAEQAVRAGDFDLAMRICTEQAETEGV